MPDSEVPGLSFDPNKSRFLLVGVGKYHKGLEDVPNARGNLDKLKRLLLDPEIVGVPDGNIRVLADPQNKSELSDAFIEAAAAAEDLLFFYYVGHGLPGRETAKLYLATANSSNENCDYDGFDFEEVRLRLTKPQPAKRVIVLDCCFAGLAIDGALGTVEGLVNSSIDIKPILPKSSYAIASAGPNRTADAGSGQPYTAFTGELIDLLENGTRDTEPTITMDKLFGHLDERIRMKPSLPRPMRRQQYDGGTLVLARNRIGTPFERQMGSLYRQIGLSVAAFETRLAELTSNIERRFAGLESVVKVLESATKVKGPGTDSSSPGDSSSPWRLPRTLAICLSLDAITTIGLIVAAWAEHPPEWAEHPSETGLNVTTVFLIFAMTAHFLVAILATRGAYVNNQSGGDLSSIEPIFRLFPRNLFFL